MEKLYSDSFKSHEFKNLMKDFISSESSNKSSKELISNIKKVSTNFSLKEISDFIYKEALQLTKSDYCYVAYVDLKNKDSVGISFSHLTDECNMYAKLGEARFKVLSNGSYGGLLGYSLDTGKSFYVHDISSHPVAHGLPPGHEPVNQFLSVPVKYEGKILGQIVVANPKDDYNHDHLKIVDKLADFFGIFLEQLH